MAHGLVGCLIEPEASFVESLLGVRRGFAAYHATIQLYEASEGVPAGPWAMPTTSRVPHILSLWLFFYSDQLVTKVSRKGEASGKSSS